MQIFVSLILIWALSRLHCVCGAIIYVDGNSTASSVGCGTDLITACPTIADGLRAASIGDTVQLQSGEYSGEGNENLKSTNFSNSTSQIIITGSTGVASDVVIFCSSENRFLAADRYLYKSIANLTIRNCSALITSPDTFGDGGALILAGVTSPVVFHNVIFFGNRARNGGALFLESSSVTTTNCLFIANEAQYWGGAINFIDTGLTVLSTVMENNHAHGDLGESGVSLNSDEAGKGGAIHGNGGSRTLLAQTEFIGNGAKLSGGAVFLIRVSAASIENSVFTENSVYGGEVCYSDQVCQVKGGAIYAKDIRVTIDNSTFIGNSAITQDLSEYAEGGAVVITSDVFVNVGTTATLKNCSFVNNTARGAGENNAGGYGGAVFCKGIPVSIDTCEFTGNNVMSNGLFSEYASGGGAVYIASAALYNGPNGEQLPEIVNCMFSRNSANGGRGGAVYMTEDSTAFIRNNTFNLNAAYSSYVVKAQGGALGIGHKSVGFVESCRFLSNFAAPEPNVYPKTYSGSGGAIFVISSTGHVKDSYFASNTASSGQFDSGAQGGAVGLENVMDFKVDNSIFIFNTARGFYGTNSYSSSGSGGAVCLIFSSAQFSNCLFSDNFASAGGSQYSLGGGVAIFYEYNSAGTGSSPLNFSNCKFVRNVAGGEVCTSTPIYRAGQGGGLGIVGVSLENVVINFTTFDSNMALTESEGLVSSYGGAIMYAQGSSVACNQCIFYKNIAWNGLGDDICSGFDDVSYATTLNLRLSKPVLNSATDFEAVKIHERFQLLRVALCAQLSLSSSVSSVDLHSAVAMSPRLRRVIHQHHLEVKSQHNQWESLSRRHISLLKSETSEDESFETESAEAWEEMEVASDDELGVVPSEGFTRRRLTSLTSRIYPSMLFLSGTINIYLPKYNNSYEICTGDLISVIVGLTEGTSTGSISTTGMVPTLVIIGSINSSELVLIGISANITVVDQSTRRGVALQSLGLLNSTFYFSNNISVQQGGAFIGSTLSSYVPPDLSNVPVNKTYLPLLNMLGDVYTGVSKSGGNINAEAYGIISLLQRTESEPFTILEKCTLRVYGRLYLATVSTNSSAARTVSIILRANSTLVMTKGSELHSESPAEIIAERASNVALVNLGTIYLSGSQASYLHPLNIFGIFVQYDPGTLVIAISNADYNEPALVASTNVSLLGTINITAVEGTKYIPSSDSDDPTAWGVLRFLAVASARGDENTSHYVYPDGIYFEDTTVNTGPVQRAASSDQGYGSERHLETEMAYASSVVAKAMASSTAAVSGGYVQQFTTSAMSCPQRTSSYSTTLKKSTDTDYLCWICLQNNSCGYCGGDGCQSKDSSCPDGRFQKKDGNCCPQMCHNHGECNSRNGHTVFECKCNFFWAGNSCSSLSVPTYLLIAASVFLVVIALITLRYYYYYRQQKKKVLQELRVGLLNGNTDDSMGENRSYLQAIQQDLILRDVFVNYDEIVFEGKIGEGSFGEVFKATFRGAQVAVKQMRAPVFMQLSENDIEEFRTEAYMMSRLRHPNIVLVMGVSIVSLILPGPPPGFEDDDDEPPSHKSNDDKARSRSQSRTEKEKEKKNEKVVRSICIITEYLEQGSLADILYGSNKVADDIWTYELVLTCALQAARGMLYLHSHQPPICHRDLKSSNLVVDDHWVVKVTDFGMSRIVPMKIQNIEKGIEKSDSVDLLGGQIDRATVLSASLAADAESLRETKSQTGTEDSSPPKKSVTINEDANMSWERESIINPEEGERHSQSNTLMTSNLGTTAWCAPELLTATNKTRYSVKVDVYSYGMVLWELWERKRPYEELYSRFDIIDAVREGRRPAISNTCPPTFRSLIQRCWHEQPARRPTFAYIVRYIKDELAHIKRQRMSSASTFSPLQQLLLGSRSKSNGSGSSVGGMSALQEDATPTQSVDSEVSKDWLNKGNSTHSAPVISHHIQSEAITSRATISYMPPSHLPAAPLAIPQKPTQESLDMLASSPWTGSEDPEESPTGVPKGYLSAPAGGPVSRAWRDKYVMKFNGWKSSNPDAGLPPSVYSTSSATPVATAAIAPSTPAQSVSAPRTNSDSPELRSQESSVDSSSEENAVSEPPLPRQGAYELDLYSSTSSISPEDLPRLPASRASDSNSSRASSSNPKRESDMR